MKYGTITDFLKQRNCFRLKNILISLIIGIFICLLYYFGTLDKFELTALDYRFKLRATIKGIPQIAIVEIAEDSIEQIGRWPWSRQWHTELIDALSHYGAAIIDMDIIFSEKSDEYEDQTLSLAIKQAANVYLPFVFENIGDEPRLIEPLPVFAENVKGEGYINILPDEDGILRRIELVKEFQGRRYYHIGFKIACDYLGVKQEDIHLYPAKFIELKNTKIGTIRIPIDEKNRMLLNWPGRWGVTFRHFSYIDTIVSYQQIKEGLRPRINLNEFKDKICLVGLTAIGLTDIKPIPLEPLYPALGVHAVIIDNIVRKNFVSVVGRFYMNIIIVLFSLIVAFIFLILRKPVKITIATLALGLGYGLIAVFLFNLKSLWLNMVYPLSSVVFAYAGVMLYSYAVTAIERAKFLTLATVDGLTGLFVIRHFKLLLEARMREAARYNQKLSIIMTDIDHFKTFNDTFGHQIGDLVLKEVARICKAAMRELDVPGRYGGEEFIFMLPNTDIEGSKIFAERLRKAVELHIFKDNKSRTHHVTISLGVAEFLKDDTIDVLIKKTDTALYLAKTKGRNRVCDWWQCQEAQGNA